MPKLKVLMNASFVTPPVVKAVVPALVVEQRAALAANASSLLIVTICDCGQFEFIVPGQAVEVCDYAESTTVGRCYRCGHNRPCHRPADGKKTTKKAVPKRLR